MIKLSAGTAKPFIKWVGGKTQLLEELQHSIPREFFEKQEFTYVEPFVGGGAFFFWMMRNMPNIGHAIINDINEDLIITYRTIQKKPTKLIDNLQHLQDEYLPLDDDKRKEYYLEVRSKFNKKSADDVENSAMLIFLNRTCFNGLYRVNSKGEFNVPHGRYTNPKICDAATIIADSEVLQKVTILHGDFAETKQFGDENTLYYFDPPYKPLSETSSFNSYAKEDFDDLEQKRLFEFCNTVSSMGSKFILSNSDVKGKNGDTFFDDMYANYNIQRVEATRMVNANSAKRGKLTELMITNFEDYGKKL